MKAERRQITFRRLQNMCRDRFVTDICWKLPSGRDKCNAKNCPIWKRLEAKYKKAKGAKMTRKCAEIVAENERIRKALGSNRQFLEEMVTAGGKHSDINGTSVVEPAYRQLTLTEQALEGREG
jgi:hypothetical protein